MTFKELKTHALDDYYPALFLEMVLRRHVRSKIVALGWSFMGLMFMVVLVAYTASSLHLNPLFAMLLPKVYGVFFFSVACWMLAFMLQTFYKSFYNKDIPDDPAQMPAVTFDLAKIIYRSNPQDLTKGFLLSRDGALMMMRTGISADAVRIFLEHRKAAVAGEQFSIPGDATTVTLSDYAGALYDLDKEFAQFLFGSGIQKKDFVAVATWISERETNEKQRVRWWSREKLGRIPGLGKNWAYGNIYYLEHYLRQIPYVSAEYETHSVYGTAELKELEAILVKNRGANAFLVGDDKEGQINIIARLNRMIEDGTSLPELSHKRLILCDNDLLTSSAHSKADLETKLLQLFHEAEYAGNIILVLINFPSLVTSGQALQSDLTSLLDQYFNSSLMQIVGLANVQQFHTLLEPNTGLMLRFEKILMQPIDESNTIKVLENEIIPVENKLGVFFTYPALAEIAEAATRYFPDAEMPDKAIDLLDEIGPLVAEKSKTIILKEDVYSLVKTKTGIPVGEVQEEERDKLLNLEKILDQRIIGQEEAVVAISNAVRRARSGINNPNKPLASFLFLGPTGVGKTETTKALAEVFFGAEAHIERLDMSEYTSTEALSKLIGSFESNKPGVLATMLREHPYGVLLLDEFEKTTPEVMNLFLQVLDEGNFSDMAGKKINARNLLIIATSNAGAGIIWEGLKQGDDFSQAKDFIIDEIIKQGTFKPELINRFDGVIVFHPLGRRELAKVAKLQLDKLKTRLAERGINLQVNDELVNYVVGFGVDPKFGARPMNRAIQDKVEQVIAEKMIRGFNKGQEVILTSADLRK